MDEVLANPWWHAWLTSDFDHALPEETNPLLPSVVQLKLFITGVEATRVILVQGPCLEPESRFRVGHWLQVRIGLGTGFAVGMFR